MNSKCVFRTKPATDSERNRPLIPEENGHRSGGKPATFGECPERWPFCRNGRPICRNGGRFTVNPPDKSDSVAGQFQARFVLKFLKERRKDLANRRKTMRKIKEVLRLKLEVGLGDRQIARSCHIARSTVSEYWRRARERSEEHTSELQSQFHLVC